jgi:hypothetical protein
MLTETQYKTFDELLDSVKLDLKTHDLEGMIDPQQLIKVAIRVNYELGLKVNPSRSKVLQVVNGKAKLPPDFYVLNFAMICEDHYEKPVEEDKTYTEGKSEGVLEGIYLAQQYYLQNTIGTYTTTVDVPTGHTTITHNLATTNLVIEAYAQDGTMLSFEILTISPDIIHIISQAPLQQGVKFVIIGAPETPSTTVTQIQPGGCSASMVNDPFYHIPKVTYVTQGRYYESKKLIQMRIDKNKSVSADCMNLQSRATFAGYLKNGFLVTNFDEGVIYINYQSLMEDDDGNLLVMDHPLANEFYEYAIKQRIYENLMMAGENVVNYLQLVEQRLRAARNNALSFVNTPGYREMQRTWELNRKAQYHKYYNMFKSNAV